MAAPGDVFSGIATVPAASSFSIRPSAGQEAVIHNLYYNGALFVQFSDGSNNIEWLRTAGPGASTFLTTHVTNALWLEIFVVDPTGGDLLIGWDGIYTK